MQACPFVRKWVAIDNCISLWEGDADKIPLIGTVIYYGDEHDARYTMKQMAAFNGTMSLGSDGSGDFGRTPLISKFLIKLEGKMKCALLASPGVL